MDATRSGIRGALGTASSARDVEPAGAEPGRCPDLDGISSRRPASVTRRGAFAWSRGRGCAVSSTLSVGRRGERTVGPEKATGMVEVEYSWTLQSLADFVATGTHRTCRSCKTAPFS